MIDVWVGIDVGTSGVRAVAVEAGGGVAGRGERPLRSRRDGPRHEQDPEDWWPAVGGACREALAQVAPERVRGVATCATSGTIVLVDRATGAPLTAALMYDDARAGAPPTWALPKLRWLLEHEPALAGRARLAHQADVVTRRLAGDDVPADSSHALKSGYDLVAEAWSPSAQATAIELPAVVRPGTVLGAVCAEAAAHTGLPAHTPIVAGMTDGCAAQIAAGALRPGDWCSVLGTTLVLKGVSERPIEDPAGVVYSHRAPGGEWLPGGASSCGAGALVAAFPGRDLDALTREAAGHLDTSVIAFPLVGRGERFPFVAPDAEAFVAGDPRCDGELLAALLLGIAFVERLCFETLDRLGAPTGGTLSLTGGAARNPVLCQLRADVLGRPAVVPERADSASGMAILAASVTGDSAPRVQMAARYAPDRARGERLCERYAAFVAELRRRGWL